MTQTKATPGWTSLAPRTWVYRNSDYDMNSGLVVGDERALLIDTGAGPDEARVLHAAVRELTDLPIVVVNTHAHFDHFFGNAYFRSAGTTEFWSHRLCAEGIEASGERQRRQLGGVEAAMAAGIGEHTDIEAPNRMVNGTPVDLDLGGISVTLFHLGRGHTDNDLLVGAGPVLFTGDLVEQGADPAFEDSYPTDWIRTLAKIVALDDLYTVFVPGHGEPVDIGFVQTQLRTLRHAVRIAGTAVHEAESDASKAIPIIPYGPEQSRALIGRLRAGL